MLTNVRKAEAMLREAAASLEPARLDPGDAAALVECFAQAEKVCAAGRMLASRRVAESRLWQREGHRTPAEWVSARTGQPLGAAIASLETAARLDELPATREAFCSGTLSEAQATQIASAAPGPEAERHLLEVAKTQTVAALRTECARVRAAADDDELARHERIRRSRYFRHWTEPDGAVRIDGRFTPEDGASLVSGVDAHAEQIFAEARRAGRVESYQAYRADALVALARGDGSGGSSGPRAMIHVVVDQQALRRGRVRAGEQCEIPGIGPIPVASAWALAADSILKTVVSDGTDITAVSHHGRTITARLRTALQARDPACVVPGCNVRRNLEIDHWRVPFALGGRTELANLARLCRWHHYQKTHLGYRLRGGAGAWAWEHPPDDP